MPKKGEAEAPEGEGGSNPREDSVVRKVAELQPVKKAVKKAAEPKKETPKKAPAKKATAKKGKSKKTATKK